MTYEVITNEDGSEFIRMTIVSSDGTETVIEIPIGTGNYGQDPMVKYLLALTILLSSCASVPRFSSEPQDCEPQTWGDEYPHDLVNYAKAVGRTFERANAIHLCR